MLCIWLSVLLSQTLAQKCWQLWLMDVHHQWSCAGLPPPSLLLVTTVTATWWQCIRASLVIHGETYAASPVPYVNYAYAWKAITFCLDCTLSSATLSMKLTLTSAWRLISSRCMTSQFNSRDPCGIACYAPSMVNDQTSSKDSSATVPITDHGRDEGAATTVGHIKICYMTDAIHTASLAS